jgi:RNA polymerase sigma-70 factor (ECF subfamily)
MWPTRGALAPDAAFDHEWALAIVERALAVLQSENEAAGHRAHFAALKPWLTPTGAPVPQSDVAAHLGLSEGAVKVAIHRLRRRFREIVHSEISQTLHDPADFDDEMRHLVSALSG